MEANRDGSLSKTDVKSSVLAACILFGVGLSGAFTPPHGVIVGRVGKPTDIQFVAKKMGELFRQGTPADCSSAGNNVTWLIANGKCVVTAEHSRYVCSNATQIVGERNYSFTLIIPSPALTDVGMYVVRDNNGQSSGDTAASELVLFDQTSADATSILWELCGLTATLAVACGNHQAFYVSGNETCKTYAIEARDGEQSLPRSLPCNFTVRISSECATYDRSVSWVETITPPAPTTIMSTSNSVPTTITPTSNPVTSGSCATNDDIIIFLVVLTAFSICFRH